MKTSVFSFVIVLTMIMAPGIAPVQAQISVVPEQHDFGELNLGDIASAQFTITNTWSGDLMIESTHLQAGGGNFSLVNPPPAETVVPPGSNIYFGVDFAPASEGFFSAQVVISWTNGASGTSTIELSGVGVSAQPPPVSIQEILAFFDASVANGSLVGAGPGVSATHRLRALRNMLVAADLKISQGDYEGACEQLNDACKRCDDFCQGSASDDLEEMIRDLMEQLGCFS